MVVKTILMTVTLACCYTTGIALHHVRATRDRNAVELRVGYEIVRILLHSPLFLLLI